LSARGSPDLSGRSVLDLSSHEAERRLRELTAAGRRSVMSGPAGRQRWRGFARARRPRPRLDGADPWDPDRRARARRASGERSGAGSFKKRNCAGSSLTPGWFPRQDW